MRVNINNVYYTNENVNPNNVKKNVLLTEYTDVLKAVNKGELSVDGVTLELSEEVRNAIKDANEQRFKDCEEVNLYNAAVHNANVAKQQGEAMEKVMDEQARALEIARRIAKGGHVPLKDEQALMEYSSELYQMAKQQALLAKEHEKYDSLIEEETTEEVNVDEGKDDTRHHVQVEVSMGETPTVESVAEVAVSAVDV